MSPLSIVTAPARLALGTARSTVGVVVDLGRHALRRVAPSAPPADPHPAAAEAADVVVATPVAPRVAPLPDAVEPDRTEQPEFEPAHLDEDPPTVVYSSADEGAQDEVGASLHVAEPWAGYRGMTVPDIVDRLVVADAATLATVQLYEQTHRARRSVLAAVARRLARAA